MSSTLVLDKSYLDGAPTVAVRTLCATQTVLCSETLFYELMTTNSRSQIRCFSKFPEEAGLFALLPNVGTLLRFEMDHNEACGPIENHILSGTYNFNKKLRLGTYQPPLDVQRTIDDWKIQVHRDAKSFLERCQSVHQFFPELIGIEFRDLPAAVAAAKARVSTNAEEVRRIFSSFERESLPPSAPHADEIDERWAWYRWVQCQVFAALRMFERYQCYVPTEPTAKVIERAEHSMHDLEYVLIASLAGSLASNDDEVIEDYRFARPEGRLVTSRPQ